MDDELLAIIEKFDRDALIVSFKMHNAKMAQWRNVADIFEDLHYAAHENIIVVEDEELGGPIRMQNFVGKFS